MRRLIAGLTVVPLLMLASPVVAQSWHSALRGLGSANEARVWRAVGRLDAGHGGFCTATLIAREFVLTAAHCVYNASTGEPLPAQDLTFRAGLRNGTSVAERAIAQIEAHAGYDPARGATTRNMRHDVALLRLAEPIPTHVLDPFVVSRAAVRPGEVSVVSYGQGRAEVPSRQSLCRVFDHRRGLLMMTCNVTFGSSGAPVFDRRSGRGQIVSVISGTGSVDGRRVTLGMVLPDLVADLRHQMRANRRTAPAVSRRVTVGGNSARTDGIEGPKFVRP